MIAIIDYGAGNLFSVQNALNYLGEPNVITKDPAELRRADSYILPGVGAYPYAMEMLQKTNLVDLIKEEVRQKPILGICLGMQMLFDEGMEFSKTKGLGLIPGVVDQIPDCGLKIPHMGWNALRIHDKSNPLLKDIRDGDCVYFVHSYMAFTKAPYLVAEADYGCPVTAFCSNGTIYGAQFHPEKSGETGLQILRNFGGLTR